MTPTGAPRRSALGSKDERVSQETGNLTESLDPIFRVP